MKPQVSNLYTRVGVSTISHVVRVAVGEHELSLRHVEVEVLTSYASRHLELDICYSFRFPSIFKYTTILCLIMGLDVQGLVNASTAQTGLLTVCVCYVYGYV